MQHTNNLTKKLLTQGEIESYVISLKRDQCPLAAEALIENYIRLGLYLAHKAHRHYAYVELADLKSMAVEIIVKRVEQIRSGVALTRDNNIGAYLHSSIKHRLRQHCIRAAQKERQQHALGSFRQGTSTTYNEAEYNLRLNDIKTCGKFSDREQFLLLKKSEGYTTEEVAKMMGLSVQRVRVLLANLKEQVKELII